MIDKAKTLDECFKELILKRGWSKNSPYDRRTASRHKKQFLEGTLPDEFKRVYLQSAGDRNYKTKKMDWRNIIRNLLEIIIAIFRMIFIGLFYIAKFMFVFFILLFFGVLISQNNKRW